MFIISSDCVNRSGQVTKSNALFIRSLKLVTWSLLLSDNVAKY